MSTEDGVPLHTPTSPSVVNHYDTYLSQLDALIRQTRSQLNAQIRETGEILDALLLEREEYTGIGRDPANVSNASNTLPIGRVKGKGARSTSRTSMIMKVPPEILSKIFCFCIPECQGRWSTQNQPSLSSAPILLEKVCRHWKVITASTPELWSVIVVTLRPDRLPAAAEFIINCIARSGQYSLSLHIYCFEEDPWHNKSPSIIIDAIATHSHRWGEIDLLLPESWLVRLHSVTEGKLPLLHTCTLSVPFKMHRPDYYPEVSDDHDAGSVSVDDSDTPDVVYEEDDVTEFYETTVVAPNALRLFCTASNLRKLSVLMNVNGDCVSPFRMIFPWEQLTEFISNDASFVVDCAEILRQSPNLMHCAFEPIRGDRQLKWAEVSGPLRLESLRTLTLSGSTFNNGSARSIAEVMDALTLPSLRELVLDDITDGVPESTPIPPLMHFVVALTTRSACHIRRLELRKLSTKDDILIEYLSLMPSLEELRLQVYRRDSNIGATSKFLEWLEIKSWQSTHALPHLSSLSYEGPFHFRPCALVQVLSSRSWRLRASSAGAYQAVRLQKVVFKCIAQFDAVSHTERRLLRKMADEGMDLLVCSVQASWLV